MKLKSTSRAENSIPAGELPIDQDEYASGALGMRLALADMKIFAVESNGSSSVHSR